MDEKKKSISKQVDINTSIIPPGNHLNKLYKKMTASPGESVKAPVAAADKVSSTSASATQPLPTAVEFEPPLACVRRILKNTLPASTNVGKDASAAFARSAGIFIMYITACANDFARESRRQTITANDVLAAVKVRLDYYEKGRNVSEAEFVSIYFCYDCCKRLVST